MVTHLENLYGFCDAYIEWQILDGQGQFKENGEYIYIQELWVHKSCDGRKAIRELSNIIFNDERSKNSKYVYWVRHKYNERKSKIYKKELFIKGVLHGF